MMTKSRLNTIRKLVEIVKRDKPSTVSLGWVFNIVIPLLDEVDRLQKEIKELKGK